MEVKIGYATFEAEMIDKEFSKIFFNMEKAKQTIRKRKLQAEHQPRASQYKTVPSLHLAGVWLEENGFKPGDTVEITTRENLLIIQPVSRVQEEITAYKEELQTMKQQLKKML